MLKYSVERWCDVQLRTEMLYEVLTLLINQTCYQMCVQLILLATVVYFIVPPLQKQKVKKRKKHKDVKAVPPGARRDNSESDVSVECVSHIIFI